MSHYMTYIYPERWKPGNLPIFALQRLVDNGLNPDSMAKDMLTIRRDYLGMRSLHVLLRKYPLCPMRFRSLRPRPTPAGCLRFFWKGSSLPSRRPRPVCSCTPSHPCYEREGTLLHMIGVPFLNGSLFEDIPTYPAAAFACASSNASHEASRRKRTGLLPGPHQDHDGAELHALLAALMRAAPPIRALPDSRFAVSGVNLFGGSSRRGCWFLPGASLGAGLEENP